MKLCAQIATLSLFITRAALAQTSQLPAPPLVSEEQSPTGPEAAGAFFMGRGLFELTPLNDRLRSNGYQMLPSMMTLVGGEGRVVFPAGVVLGAHGVGLLSSMSSGPMGMQTQFGGGFGLLDLGYAFVHSAPLLVTFCAGIGG